MLFVWVASGLVVVLGEVLLGLCRLLWICFEFVWFAFFVFFVDFVLCAILSICYSWVCYFAGCL